MCEEQQTVDADWLMNLVQIQIATTHGTDRKPPHQPLLQLV